jgi:hypothetical protein
VSWRRSNDYVGWAALPPEGEGFSVSLSISSSEPPPHAWVLVPVKQFVEPDVSVNIIIGDQKPDVFQQTQFAGPVVVQNNIVVNNVIDINFIQQQTNVQVPKLKAQQATDVTASTEPQGDTVAVVTTDLPAPKGDEKPQQAEEPQQAAQQLNGDKGNGGQNGNAPAAPAAPGAPAPGANPPANGTPPANGASPPAAEPNGNAQANGNANGQQAQPGQGANGQKPAACPDGQVMQDGKCVPAPAKDNGQQAPADNGQGKGNGNAQGQGAQPPANDQNAAPAQPASPAASNAETKPKASEGNGAKAPEKCPDGQVLQDGKCVPAQDNGNGKQPEQPAANVQDQAPAANGQDQKPADNQGKAAPPSDQQQAAPADNKGKGAPAKCPAGEELVKGKCVPIPQGNAPAAPAQ